MNSLIRIESSDVRIKTSKPIDDFISEVGVGNFYEYTFMMFEEKHQMIVADSIGGWYVQNFEGVLVPLYGVERSAFHYLVNNNLADCKGRLNGII